MQKKKKTEMVVAHKNWASFSKKKKKKVWSSGAVPGIFENGRRALTLALKKKKNSGFFTETIWQARKITVYFLWLSLLGD